MHGYGIIAFSTISAHPFSHTCRLVYNMMMRENLTRAVTGRLTTTKYLPEDKSFLNHHYKHFYLLLYAWVQYEYYTHSKVDSTHTCTVH